ncbi:MAG: GNAT family N-acetyltransferase [Verrucomicrobia bacterium]|nr:GNAT family N-acetyltransferase [Verrucomicrobiota bacterium]
MPAPTPPAYRLRAATPDDLAFQAQLYATTRLDEMEAAGFPAEMRGAFVAMQFNAQTTHYTQHYPAAEWSIIECDGARVGRLIVHRAEDHFNVIDIALMPEYRGRGIGTVVLRELIAEASARLLPIQLFAFSGEHAIQLYHRLGFADVHDDGLHTELVWRPAAVLDKAASAGNFPT